MILPFAPGALFRLTTLPDGRQAATAFSPGDSVPHAPYNFFSNH